MKYFSLFFLLFFLMVSCDNSLKKYEESDFDLIEADEEDSDLIENDNEISDSDTEFSIKEIAVYKEAPEFFKGEELLIQNARLNFETLVVTRTFRHVDTSFSMHKDDAETLINSIGSEFSENLCVECLKSGDQTKIVFDDSECCIEEEPVVKEIEHYLLIPIHTMSWPFEPQNEPHPVGHTSLSFQNYSEGYDWAYFHHGTDIVLPNPEKLYNIYDGRVTEVGYYRVEELGEESPYYFQVIVKTVNGLTIQYHHTDDKSVTEKVYDLEGSDEILEAGEQVGKIVFWPSPDSFSENFFHHVHLNIMTQEEIKLNALELMFPQNDSEAPEIEEISLIDSDRTKTLDNEHILEPFQVVVKANDLADSDPWPNPPRKIDVRIENSDGETVFTHQGYDFIAMMHPDEKIDVCTYYLCEMDGTEITFGNYSEREFYIISTAFNKLGEKTEAIDPAEFESGDYTLVVTTCDESGNCTEKEENIGF